MDGLALQAIAESDEPTILMTQVVDDGADDEHKSLAKSTTAPALYPLQPPVSAVGDFKTTPMIHVGYATTWFGLSAAGMYMTRKLITKGRY
jgi:hypothetical protein